MLVTVASHAGIANRIKNIMSALSQYENVLTLHDPINYIFPSIEKVDSPTNVYEENWRLYVSSEEEEKYCKDYKTIDLLYENTPKYFIEKYLKVLKKLVINPEIVNFVDEFTSDWENMVGVHIRSWYCLKNRFHSNEIFQEQIDKLNPEKFFFCCDNSDVQNYFTDRYKDKILTYDRQIFNHPHLAESGHHDDIQITTDAFIELLILSKCSTIIGTYDSTFDEVAWWMSGCKSKVIIPKPKNFDQQYHDCQYIKKMKKDLSKATFIMPIRIESADRMRNVITSILFLLKNFNTNIIVKEVDEKSIFQEDVLPQIKECVGQVENLIHIFEESNDPVFYRMQILNEMLSITTTEIVVNIDCDVLLPIQSYVDSYESILSGESDIVYPYGNGNYQKQVFVDDELVSEFLNNDCDFSILDSKSKIWTSDFGWIQFFNRKVYVEGGMENENFRGSSPEDKERFFRFTTLGYKVKRIDEFIYHLEHSRGKNSWPTSIQGNPYMSQNFEVWNTIQKMNREQLVEYYSNQEYLKKYL